jgi:general secretion pathway protein K
MIATMILMKHKQKGIALIQVLLISAIITVFAIYLSQTARQQVSIASLLNDRSQAAVSIHDSESLVLFNLLTKQSMVERKAGVASENDKQNVTYYYGQKLSLNVQTITTINDLSGKLSIFTPERSILEPLLLAQGYTQSATNSIYDTLLDWQDTDKLARLNGAESSDYSVGPRNQKIPFIEELLQVKNMAPELYSLLHNNLSEIPAAGFNPIVASEELINALYPDVANQLIELRKQENLTSQLFSRYTNIQSDEWFRLYPSNRFRMRIESTVGAVALSKLVDLEINRYSRLGIPLKIFSIKWNAKQ